MFGACELCPRGWRDVFVITVLTPPDEVNLVITRQAPCGLRAQEGSVTAKSDSDRLSQYATADSCNPLRSGSGGRQRR